VAEFYRNLNQAAIDADAPEVGDAPALFISRKDAPDKRLINEDRIVDLLRSRIGEIKVIELGDYSLMEQIAMFRKAPLVIGPIGQGICNALFCRGSVLVVLAPGEEGAEVYKSSHGVTLARICGNEAMTFLSGEDVPSRGDWEFPESHFSELMDRLLAQPEAARILPQTP
jgi:capsular polysaccharide biosynthesis protein